MTTSYAGYVCWDRANVADTINTEAVHADPAVFLATHRPLAIVRRAWESQETGERVDERAVLDDFLKHTPTGGVVLMPVIGESGTGKSHLVRWVREQLQDDATRRVIYLRKTETNLPAVIRALLADLEGPQFQEIRDQVGRSLGQFDERALPHEILDRLALVVQFSSPDDAPSGSPAAKYRKLLTNEKCLPTLLRDYEYRKHLLAPNGFLTRFAAELRHGRSRQDGERQTAFEPQDLIPDVDPNAIGPVAGNMYKQLYGSAELREESAKLLTENLDRAVLRLTELDGGRLFDAMVEIRREFHRRGQEILLLIEDFALIQGIQGVLLEAIVEAGVREGRQELATIRTLMAVTSGYFSDQIPETPRGRIKASVPYMYQLDIPISENQPIAVDGQHVVDFVARYLNAARVGRTDLVQTYQSEIPEEQWPPNACKKCSFRESCHEAFGRSSEGFGLYPYNRAAIMRTVQVTSDRDSDAFNPRAVLSRAIRQVLDNYDTAIPSANFPPRSFLRDFPRSRLDHVFAPEVAARLIEVDPESHERRLDLLEFWGDTTAGITNLAPGIHEAFMLPELPASVLDEAAKLPRQATRKQDTPEPRNEPLTPLQARLNVVDAWFSRGEFLLQEYARPLRSWLRQAVTARVAWREMGLPYPTEKIYRAVLGDKYGVIIRGAFGEKGAAEPRDATIVLEKDAVTATMLKAVFQREALGHWNFSGGPTQQRLLAQRLDTWGEAMVQAVREHVGVNQPETITAAVATSLLGARVLDLKGSRSRSREDLLAAVMATGSTTPNGAAGYKDAEIRTKEWKEFANQHLADRARLVEQLRQATGAAQGDGAPQIVDATVLLPVIDTVIDTVRLGGAPDALPEWVSPAYEHLRRALDGTVAAQWTHLRTLVAEYRSLIGTAEHEALLKELEGALAVLPVVAPGAGGRTAEAWLEDLQLARKYPWVRWRDLATELEEADAPGEASDDADTGRTGEAEQRLRLTAVDRGAQFFQVLTFLRNCDRWLDNGLQTAERQRSVQPADAIPELKQVIDDIDTLLDTWREDRDE